MSNSWHSTAAHGSTGLPSQCTNQCPQSRIRRGRQREGVVGSRRGFQTIGKGTAALFPQLSAESPLLISVSIAVPQDEGVFDVVVNWCLMQLREVAVRVTDVLLLRSIGAPFLLHLGERKPPLEHPVESSAQPC